MAADSGIRRKMSASMSNTHTTELAGGRIIVSRDGAVAKITFNKPAKMNAMSLDMWQGLQDGLDALADDDTVRVVILTGAGDKAFVSGADISEFETQRSSEDSVRRYNAISEAADAALYHFPKPTIAQIQGYCVGGGMGLAVGCDLRICSDDSRLGITAARLGLGYNQEGVRKLVDLAGPKIRLGQLKDDSVVCSVGNKFTFVRGTQTSAENELTCNYEPLIDEVKVGDSIVLADGALRLTVIEAHPDHLNCRAADGGCVRSRQGVNLPATQLSVRGSTEHVQTLPFLLFARIAGTWDRIFVCIPIIQ